MNILFDLFLTFAKIGLFTFGGGYAMISVIETHCIEKKKWITHDDMMNITVIAESTPGPIAINCATFVGYKQAGISGAIFSTLGVALPSFFIIYIISMFFDNFLTWTIVANAFKGIKIAVGFLILDAAITMLKKMPQQTLPKTIMLCSFIIMMLINIFALNFSTIYLMILAGLISLIVFTINNSLIKNGGENTK